MIWTTTKHFQVLFGAYVQANQDNSPTNTQAGRFLDTIYLRPMNNIQGGHEVMNLATGQVITRAVVRECPLTQVVINAVESIAARQGIKSLKLFKRDATLLFPGDWTTGVEYDEENFAEI